MTPSLLNLPQELRDFIIEHALISTSRPPPIHSRTGEATEELQDIDYVSRSQGRGIHYLNGKHQTSAFGLLLANQQIHNETKAAISRLSSAGTKYTMDLILENEEFLNPTWTFVPPLTRTVDAFEVTFRIFGTANNETNGFMDVDGSTGSTIWRLYSVLERFMRCGALAARSPAEDRRLRLKVLYLNILTPSTNSETTLAPDDISPDKLPLHRKETDPHNQILHPEALAKFMYVWVAGILRLGDPTYALPGTPVAKYAKLFFERIEDIKIAVDGENMFHIDVVEMAREIREKNEWFSSSIV
ncbi:hypothetical protein EJ08DRAFT_214250 [Tothia fuscella]|uniref:Uncharacterized protein n=1 Tax=Tothia fuscella TaxID=1048955 RepID=A0A9P4NS25_9PEZI|nr:hypothetical protein EJ08DRAFT_214250 [Tothia fuscella]